MSGTITHGTHAAYRHHKCRCEICVSFIRAYDREYWRRRGRQPKGNPVEHDGVTYPTQADAARTLGVSTSAICAALNADGDLSRIGKTRGHSKGGRKNPVRIGPRVWPPRKALAAYLGESEDTVRGWFRRGCMERLIAAVMRADAREAAQARRAAA